jgi:hypothetical protein
MANITYNAQSFTIDGRRIWLVSGAVHYARTPHQLWRSRIRAAKQAGLNTIETYVFWNLHEPQPGIFDFEGDRDLRRFVEIVGEEGMYCVLRPGPYVCSEWDFGGLPAWLHLVDGGAKIRQGDPAFLQAVARYLDAVMQQVRDLQITTDEGGPIILVQNENEWFCTNQSEGEAYLDQITRYLRESGCTVPLINCNNLWQPASNTIDCWNGWNHLIHDMRQLRLAQPDAPRLVTELWTGWFDAWDAPHESGKSPDDLLRKIVQVSAAGAQANLYMFHGGTNFGFYGGRTVGRPDMYMTTSYDFDAPLLEAGGRGGKYRAVKRIGMFLDQFAPLMAHLKPEEHHTVLAPDDKQVTVIQQTGPLGSVVFFTRPDPLKPQTVQVLTPMGQQLPVHLGRDAAAWIVLNANLRGAATLDLTNLRPWAFVKRRMLVLFGPSGTDGLLSIGGAVLQETVPTGATPLVTHHQDLTIVILNEKQVDAAYLHDDGRLFVGVDGFDEAGEPIRGDAATAVVVHPDGATEKHKFGPKPRKPTPPKLGEWRWAGVDHLIEGSAARFAAIDGPRSLVSCGADFGYGWYRFRIDRSRAGKVALLAPEGNDRLHLYQNKSLKAVLGFGPGATDEPVNLSLKQGENELVFLADNLGRFNYGAGMGELKGLFGHLLDVKSVRLTKPERTTAPAADPFEITGWAPHCRVGDRGLRSRYTYTVPHRRKTPLVLVLRGERPRSVILVNDQPLALDGALNTTNRWVLDPDRHLKQGNNRITIALLADEPEDFDIREAVACYEAREVLSVNAEWSYARWEMPDDSDFAALPKQTPARPAWYRTTFAGVEPALPLFLEIDGMTKGQIYLNGRNIGRYFVASHTGRKVPPQTRYYLPEPWLRADDENELTLFEEHGKHPTKCKLVYDPNGPYGNWT